MYIGRNEILKYYKGKREEPVKVTDLIIEIYNFIKFLSINDTYGIAHDTKRSLMEIIFNIAYCETANSVNEAKYFLDIARGSFADVKNKLLFCDKFDSLSDKYTKTISDNINKIEKMIDNLKRQTT